MRGRGGELRRDTAYRMHAPVNLDLSGGCRESVRLKLSLGDEGSKNEAEPNRLALIGDRPLDIPLCALGNHL